MSEYYSEGISKEKLSRRGKIYYRTAEEIELPYDYFEDIKKGLAYDLERKYVSAEKCLVCRIKLDEEFQKLKRELAHLDSRLTEVEGSLGIKVEVKDMTLDEAKPIVEKFVIDFLSTHGYVYPSDVAEELGLEYGLIREIFDILEKEGKLKKKGD